LGKTGVEIPALILGGGKHGVTKMDTRTAIEFLHRALDLGLNYIDTATAYGNGGSELKIGEVLKTRRSEVFLATKLDQRTKAGAKQELKDSMARLQTDRVDLIQLHAVIDEATLEQILAPDGAYAAVQEAKKAGLIRFIGITGHKDPKVLRRAIEMAEFDTVLVPVGCLETAYGEDFISVLLPETERQGIGVLGMKALGHGLLEKSPLAPQMIRYALNQPIAGEVIAMNSIQQLESNLALINPFIPLPEGEQRNLVEHVRPLATPQNLFWRSVG